MWIPKTVDEIENVISSGSIEESTNFDAKKEISKNIEIAKDVAAMAVDGGVIIYGVGEDEFGRPTVLNPIPLDGERERVSAIIQSSIAEAPFVSISALPTKEDASRGYLVVVVPPSTRAPHMVTVKGEFRYYGRTATGNTPLNEGEVARLYERRQRMEVDRNKLLENEVENSTYPPNSGYAYMFLYAKPTFYHDGFINKALSEEKTPQLLFNSLIESVMNSQLFPQNFQPDFRLPARVIRRTEGLFAKLRYPEAENDMGKILDVQLDFDGSIHLFCGRAADRENSTLTFFPELVAGLTTRFIALGAKYYSMAQYFGTVDLGVALTGLRNTVPYTMDIFTKNVSVPYDRDEYRKTDRISTLSMSENPQLVAKDLLMPLFDAVSQGRIDPFPKKQS